MLLNELESRLGKFAEEEREGREELLRLLAELALEEPLSDLGRLRAVLEELPSPGLAAGRRSGSALRAARVRNALRVLEDRARLREECVPGAEVARGLGVSRQRLHQLRAAGRLLAVSGIPRRGSLYPAWQFTEGGEVFPGLERVIGAAREAEMDPETLHFFMMESNDRLGGETPADLLAAGEVNRVVEVLESAGLGPF